MRGEFVDYCNIEYSSFKSITSLTNVCIKTNDIYLRDVSNIVHGQIINGLRYPCVFSKLSYFKIVESFPVI